jgi:hypothetical protein
MLPRLDPGVTFRASLTALLCLATAACGPTFDGVIGEPPLAAEADAGAGHTSADADAAHADDTARPAVDAMAPPSAAPDATSPATDPSPDAPSSEPPASDPPGSPTPSDPPPAPAACLPLQQSCQSAADCCDGASCELTPLTLDDPGELRCCRAASRSCSSTDDCCGLLVCQGGTCQPRTNGGPCLGDPDCASGHCQAGTCAAPAPPPGSGGGSGPWLPWQCGVTYRTTQGNHGDICGSFGGDHVGKGEYAFDFALPLNTSVLAAENGTVSLTRSDVQPGNACYGGGGVGCANTVNYVVVDRGDGTSILYLHLDQVQVSVGQAVVAGQPIGLSGSTGWSSGPHLHIQRMQSCGSWWCQSVPLDFVDGGVPACGASVTSENAC